MSQVRTFVPNVTAVALKCGITAFQIAKIGIVAYKFSPKGYIPLSDFYKIYYEEGSPIFAPLRHILPLWLQKVGLYTGLLSQLTLCDNSTASFA